MTNDRNVYDDVEVLRRDADVTRTAIDATSSRDKNGNGDVENDKPNVIATASNFAVQRTVALMVSWILTVCSYVNYSANLKDSYSITNVWTSTEHY